ncbi:MAG: hypothetical protein OXE85_15475, partial [Roseovarius sp.]|nr:hypothetical protein [Roseovarius sp.]
ATFGIGGTDPSVKGDINDFKFVGGSEIPNWNAKVTGNWAAGNAPNTVNSEFKVSDGATGEWGVNFYSQTLTDGYPEDAVGHFDLTFDDGRAVGAFNADRREPPATDSQ